MSALRDVVSMLIPWLGDQRHWTVFFRLATVYCDRNSVHYHTIMQFVADVAEHETEEAEREEAEERAREAFRLALYGRYPLDYRPGCWESASSDSWGWDSD